jgi:serine phosphatase RsbU (regulator of sigma subunit)
VLALEAGELGTWQWERDGAVIWDATMEQLCGLPPGGFDGTFDAWVALLHPDDATQVLQTVDQAVEAKTSYQIDHRVVWPDGTVRWIQGRGTVTLGPDGEVTGTIGCCADISDRKRAELEHQRRAEQADRVALLERHQRERLEFLVRLTAHALEANDHYEFLASATAAAVPELGDWCSVHFLPPSASTPEVAVAHVDPDRVSWARELTLRYPFDPDAPTGVAAVIRTGELEFLPEITQELLDEALDRTPMGRDEAAAIIDALQLTSAVTVPLTTTQGVIGAMQFVSAESGRRYTEADVALALAAAGRIAQALENMWLTEQQRHIAATLQEALLPPAMPEIPGVEVAVRYWAAGASDVGGDFYDVFPLAGDRWAVVIGDVCGTGPGAAAVTGIARHTIRAAAKHGQDHRGVLEWLDEAVRASQRNLFCTACYATIERTGDRWRLRSSAGGHPLPIVVRAAGGAESVGVPGTILGMLDHLDSTEAAVDLDEGDLVLFYTDGLTDVPPPHGLTADDVAHMAELAGHASSAEHVVDEIQRLVNEHLPMAMRHDDIALVVLRVAPTSTG